MTGPIRFIISVDPAWRVEFACEQDSAWRIEGDSGTHRLIKVADADGDYFPGPSVALHEPDADHETLEPSPDIAEVREVYQSILVRETGPPRIARLGHYLFDVLLGPARWAQIQQHAEELGATSIELALRLPPDDRDLNRLNWEMMCSDAGFLARRTKKLSVAITRQVPRRNRDPATRGEPPAPLGVPPRVLFVVGTSLSEDQIRPGAELSGLLRNACGGRAMSYRVLQRTSPRTLKQVVRTFRPDIVHFICHGAVDKDRGFYLDLQTDEPDADPRRFAEQLFEDLDADGEHPTIVVLSACLTGGAPGASCGAVGGHLAAPLAERLVAAGIPIVVGMAGRVADITCRLFARRFGQAVIQGEPLVQATAVARQVAFVEGRDGLTNADWAFPAIFVADNVPADYTPVEPATDTDTWATVERWITSYCLPREPIFCDREDHLRRFHRMFESTAEDGSVRKLVLALFTDTNKPGYGRTRLLQEFAAQGLREGHIPVMLAFAKEPRQPVRNLEALTREFARSILEVRVSVIGLDGPASPQLDAILDGREAVKLDPVLGARALWGEQGELTASVISHAIRRDLAMLLADARRQVGFFARDRSQVVVLLDNVDELEQTLVDLLFLPTGGLFNGDGLGLPNQSPVPVVMTCSLGGNADGCLRPLNDGPVRPSWLRVAQLGPFSSNGEDMLAYELVLLHPLEDQRMPIFEGISDKPWAFNDEVEKPLREEWEGHYRRRLMGMPANLATDDFYDLIAISKTANFTVSADDEVWLNKIARPE